MPASAKTFRFQNIQFTEQQKNLKGHAFNGHSVYFMEKSGRIHATVAKYDIKLSKSKCTNIMGLKNENGQVIYQFNYQMQQLCASGEGQEEGISANIYNVWTDIILLMVCED